MSLLPSSKTLRFVIRPGGKDPGPEGEGRCLMLPIPGLGARLGGVARPRPLSVSARNETTISELAEQTGQT